MIDKLRRCAPLVFIAFLLVACVPTVTADNIGGNGNKNITATPTPTAQPNTPTTAVDTCPGGLKAAPGCYTPHQFQVAYGVEPLLQKGYTGKGQTVIDLVSFGSPTLKQEAH